MNLTEFQRSKFSDSPHFLLLGNPVDHSLSPLMHNTAAEHLDIDIGYYAVGLRADELSSVAAHFNLEQFGGANITIPYKHMLMEYVDRLSVVARNIGAINTVVKKEDMLIGDNTDIYGFSVPLKQYAGELAGSRAVIFGTGGATKAVIHALFDYSVEEIILISRSPDERRGFSDIDRVLVAGYDAWTAYSEEASIIINATPLGMHPDENSSPVRDEEAASLGDKICYDIVYNPLNTRFLKQAEEAGARTIGGLEMLIHQGSKSFELWTGEPFPIETVRAKLHEHITR